MTRHNLKDKVQQLLRERAYDEAVQLLESLQLEDSLPQSYWYLKAQALEKTGDMKGAVQAYRSQIATSDKVPHAIQLAIGVHLLEQGNFLESAICLNEFCQLELPNDQRSTGLFFLACSIGKLGMKTKQRELLHKAIELNPSYDEAWHNLGASYLDDDSAKSIKPFLRALEIDQQRSDTCGGLAAAYLDQNEYKRAIECAENGLAINPLSGICYQTIGECYEKLGDLQKAEGYYRKAFRCDYDKPRAILSLILLLTVQAERADEVENLLLVGLRSWPDDSRVLKEAKVFIQSSQGSNSEIVEAVSRIENFQKILRESLDASSLS